MNDPASLLTQAAAGTITAEAIGAVQAVYPNLFQRIQLALADELATHPSVPRQSRVSIAALLGADVGGGLAALSRNQPGSPFLPP